MMSAMLNQGLILLPAPFVELVVVDEDDNSTESGSGNYLMPYSGPPMSGFLSLAEEEVPEENS